MNNQRQRKPRNDLQLPPASIEHVEIYGKFKTATEILVCRCLGEPYHFYKIEGKLKPVMLDGISQDYAAILNAAIIGYDEERKYGVYSIATKTATEYDYLLQLAQQHAETDLEEAFDNFFDQYQRLETINILQSEIYKVTQGQSIDDVRIESDKIRTAKALDIRAEIRQDGIVEFEKKLLNAFDGIEPQYPCKPFLNSMRPFISHYEAGDFEVVAGRSGMGKSYYALNQLRWCAVNNVPALYVNLEMSEATVYERLWQMQTNVEFKNNMKGLTPDQIQKYMEDWERVKKSCVVPVSPGRDVGKIIAAITQAFYKYGIQLVVLDYIQLCKDYSGGKVRTYELESIIYDIKEHCGRLGIPCMCLAQLDRGLDRRGGGRPINADLKDTSALENAATIVTMLYRPEYYDITEDENGIVYPAQYADATVTKGRKTGKGRVMCRFNWVLGFHDAIDENTASLIATEPQEYSPMQTQYKQTRSDDYVPF